MTEVVLINPPDFIKGEGKFFSKFLSREKILPPLGLAYIASVLKQNGISVKIIDINALGVPGKRLKEILVMMNPSIVGITCNTFTFRAAMDTARIVKDSLPGVFLVMGGPHITVLGEETLRYHKEIDCGIVSEGEAPMLEVAREYLSGGNWCATDNIIYRKNGCVITNRRNDRPAEVNSIPMPARELLPENSYREFFSHGKTTSLVTSRGCAFACAFCAKWLKSGLRLRSPENIILELEKLVNGCGYRNIIFYDDTFTVSEDRIRKLCRLIIGRRLKFRWSCFTRADRINPDLLLDMRKAGCRRVSLGIESASQRVLDNLKKGISMEDAARAVRLIREAGIQSVAYFMYGSPGDTPGTMKQTFRFSRELQPDYAYYSITILHPGTELYDYAEERGYISRDYWRQYVERNGSFPGRPPYLIERGVTPEFLERFQRNSYLFFYMRPGYILKKILHNKGKESIKVFFKVSRIAFALAGNFIYLKILRILKKGSLKGA